jgi:hypothetical protein
MSPYQHGEVFVTADGAETDLDWGIMSDLQTPLCLALTASPRVQFIRR